MIEVQNEWLSVLNLCLYMYVRNIVFYKWARKLCVSSFTCSYDILVCVCIISSFIDHLYMLRSLICSNSGSYCINVHSSYHVYDFCQGDLHVSSMCRNYLKYGQPFQQLGFIFYAVSPRRLHAYLIVSHTRQSKVLKS